ncbi:protein of unknown function [Paraburkholderia kururiensis]
MSSLMLPSEAPMPPCAATVCERVGNTFESTQTERPARASCSDARIPEPPAPTITTSKRRRGRELLIAAILLHSPENLRSVARTCEQPEDRQGLQHQPHANRLDVVHPDVAHADPGVIKEREQRDEGGELHPLRGEDRGPAVVGKILRSEEPDEQDDGVDRHDGGGNTLREPVAQTVVRADDKTLRADAVIGCHFSEHPEEFCRNGKSKERGNDQDDDRGLLALFLGHRAVVGIHQKVTDAGAEVEEEGPGEDQHDELDDDAGQEAFEHFEAEFGGEALIEQIQQEGQEDEQQCTAYAMKDRYAPCERQTVREQYLPEPDVPEFRPRFFYGFSHARPLLL